MNCLPAYLSLSAFQQLAQPAVSIPTAVVTSDCTRLQLFLHLIVPGYSCCCSCLYHSTVQLFLHQIVPGYSCCSIWLYQDAAVVASDWTRLQLLLHLIVPAYSCCWSYLYQNTAIAEAVCSTREQLLLQLFVPCYCSCLCQVIAVVLAVFTRLQLLF